MDPDDDRTVVRNTGFSPRPVPPTQMNRTPDMNRMPGMNALPNGTRLEEFEIVDLIGEGGFGIVYLAYDHSLDGYVAIKEYMPSALATRTQAMFVTVLSQHHAETFAMGLKSFINEARLLRQFDSRSLVKVHRLWEANGTAYMAMPYYEGATLKQAFRERRILPDEPWIRVLLSNLLDAIDTIHQAHCLHRDIAPDNILLLNDGRPLLLDFGAARRVIGDLTHGLTVILKPGFAPIEQYSDTPGMRQGPWTDIYALAAVVYYLINGAAPPPAVARIVHDQMVPARKVGRGRYSESFLATIDKALAVRPEQRVQSVAALREALELPADFTPTLPPTKTRRTAGSGPAPGSGHNRPAEPGRPGQPPGQDGPWTGTGTANEDWCQAMVADRRPMPPPREWRPVHAAVIALFLCAGAGGAAVYYLHASSSPPPATLSRAGSATPPAASVNDTNVALAPPGMPATSASPSPAAPAMRAGTTPAPAAAESNAAPRTAPAAAPAPTPSPEDEFWKAATRVDTAEQYATYLSIYPHGKHAADARTRLLGRTATAAPQPPVTQPENASEQEPRPAARTATASEPSETKRSAATEALAIAGAKPVAPVAPPRSASANIQPDRKTDKEAQPKSSALPKTREPEATSGNSAASDGSQVALARPDAAVPPAAAKDDRQQNSSKDGEKQKDMSAPSLKSQEPSDTARKTLKLGGQTMIGNFTQQPGTGRISGSGRIEWDNGDRFEGTLVDGIKEGQGRFTWANGQQYSGQWHYDQPNGRGVLQFANGNRYDGEVTQGVPNGKGTTHFRNRDTYTGNWVMGVQEGTGEITWANGDRYRGGVRNGLPHGEGTTRFKSGDIYAGGWVNGKQHGHGRYTWRNGDYWEGEFRDGVKTDNGRQVYASRGTPPAATASAGDAGKQALDAERK